MKRSVHFLAALVGIALSSVSTGVAADSPRETLSREAPNASAWAVSALDETVPPEIRRNLTFLREDLLDEGKAASSANAVSYKTGCELCNALIVTLDERERACVRAGFRTAQANAATKVTSADLEARRNYLMSWTQYSREQSQRTEIARQQNNQVSLAKEQIRVDWAEHAGILRRQLDELYRRYRDALRQDTGSPLVESSTVNFTPKRPAAPVVVAKPETTAKFFSLGMKFVPVPGTKVLFSIWDTRVQDYQAFVTATGRAWEKPGFEQGPTHPAVNVSWEDAKAFCAWLTEQERHAGTLTSSQEYRLPTDLEWSAAVGLENETGRTPQARNGKVLGIYPWGTEWPPPRGAGNYDEKMNVDDFAKTSPVGSFATNRFGLYDMGGNVWQWCEDSYEGYSGGNLIHRGASYKTKPLKSRPDGFILLSSYRSARIHSLNSRVDDVGFRCVLAGGDASR